MKLSSLFFGKKSSEERDHLETKTKTADLVLLSLFMNSSVINDTDDAS